MDSSSLKGYTMEVSPFDVGRTGCFDVGRTGCFDVDDMLPLPLLGIDLQLGLH